MVSTGRVTSHTTADIGAKGLPDASMPIDIPHLIGKQAQLTDLLLKPGISRSWTGRLQHHQACILSLRAGHGYMQPTRLLFAVLCQVWIKRASRLGRPFRVNLQQQPLLKGLLETCCTRRAGLRVQCQHALSQVRRIIRLKALRTAEC